MYNAAKTKRLQNSAGLIMFWLSCYIETASSRNESWTFGVGSKQNDDNQTIYIKATMSVKGEITHLI